MKQEPVPVFRRFITLHSSLLTSDIRHHTSSLKVPSSLMTQSERWQARYDEVVAFMEENHRRPSKYAAEERLMWNWMRRNMKLMTRGELPAERMQQFSLLLELADKYRRVNQYI